MSARQKLTLLTYQLNSTKQHFKFAFFLLEKIGEWHIERKSKIRCLTKKKAIHIKYDVCYGYEFFSHLKYLIRMKVSSIAQLNFRIELVRRQVIEQSELNLMQMFTTGTGTEEQNGLLCW